MQEQSRCSQPEPDNRQRCAGQDSCRHTLEKSSKCRYRGTTSGYSQSRDAMVPPCWKEKAEVSRVEHHDTIGGLQAKGKAVGGASLKCLGSKYRNSGWGGVGGFRSSTERQGSQGCPWLLDQRCSVRLLRYYVQTTEGLPQCKSR